MNIVFTRDPFWAHRRSFLAALVLATVVSVTLATSVFAAPGGETLSWSLDDGAGATAADGSGNGLDGAVVGASWTSGAIGGAIDLTGGSHERVRVVDPSLDLDTDGEISISFWMNSTTIPSSSEFHSLVRRRNTSGSPEGYAFFLTGPTPRLNFDLEYGFSSAGVDTSAAGLLDGEWHHIVGVIDNSGLELWVDGTLRGTDTKSAHTSSSSEPFVLGTHDDASNSQFDYDGLLDEVRVYPSALGTTEIADLYDDILPPLLVVNSTGDTSDALPGDGICDTGGTNVDGADECTLRAAIEETNAGSAETIHFNIPVGDPGNSGSWWTITPTGGAGSLPEINGAIDLDASTQPGWVDVPVVVVDGTNLSGFDDVLTADTDAMTLRGVAIVNGPDDGLSIEADDVVVDRIHSGVLPDGTAAGNGDEGVDAQGGAARLTVQHSVISSNVGSGISLSGPDAVVVSNLIGVAPDGVTARGNLSDGIRFYDNAVDAIIGRPGEGNVIGANGVVGIELDGDPVSATIQSNAIGTDATGTLDLGHDESAILFQETSADSVVGMSANGVDTAEGNLLMFNGGGAPYAGINVRDSVTGFVSMRGNSIARNDGLGIDLGESNAVSPNDADDVDGGANGTLNFPDITAITESTPGTLTIDFDHDSVVGAFSYDVYGNTSGPDATGFGEGQTWLGRLNAIKTAVGAESFSVDVPGTVGEVITMTATRIDGTEHTSEFSTWAAAAASVATVNSTGAISDSNAGDGICWTGGVNSEGAMECTLRAAVEEANAAGVVDTIEFDLPLSEPGYDGVNAWWVIADQPPSITTPLSIDGTTQTGTVVNAQDAPNPITSRLQIMLDGSAESGALLDFVSGSDGSTVRGLSIVGIEGIPGDSGVRVADADGVSVVGNHIGLAPDGTTSSPNEQGVAFVLSSSNGTLGGTAAADRNLIATNEIDVAIRDTASDIVVEGNEIGYDATGAVVNTLANDAGVRVGGDATARVGGPSAAHGNRIAGSEGGVTVEANARVTVLGNAMTSLNRPAIDLGRDDGTPNDPLDADTGPNDLLNAPTPTSSVNTLGTTSLDYTLDVPAGTYRIEVFANPGDTHPMTFPFTGVLLATDTVVHPGGGALPQSMSLTGAAGDVLTMTTTEDLGGGTFGVTSEPSDSIATAGTEAVINSTGDAPDANTGDGRCDTGGTNSEGDDECTLRAALEEAAASVLMDRFDFAIPTSDPGYDGINGWWTIAPATSLPPVQTTIEINATTQPGSVVNTAPAPANQNGRPAIRLDGAALVADDGIRFEAGSSGSELRGFSIIGFTGTDATAVEVVDTDTVLIAGNHLGLDPDGQTAQANTEGLNVTRSSDVTIGGSAAADRNMVAGNTTHAIRIPETTPGLVIRGNDIGIDNTGTTVPSAGGTIVASLDASGTIGGTGTTDANRISGATGVELVGAARFTVLGNHMVATAGPALDLLADGVTANDGSDADTGPNDLLNHPELVSAIESGGSTTIQFDLDVPAGSYRIETFSNPSGTHPMARPQMEVAVDAATIVHAGAGTQSYAIVQSATPGDILTMTVTEDLGAGAYGATSEPSASMPVLPDTVTVNSTGDSSDTAPGDGRCDTGGVNAEANTECTLRAAIEEANASSLATTVEFGIPITDLGYDGVNGWWTIAVPTNLPAISTPITIDGTSAGATVNTAAAPAPLNSRLTIELDGSAGTATDGIDVIAGGDGSELRGLAIVGFSGAGESGVQINGADGVVVAGNHLGMRPDGTTAGANHEGIVLSGGSDAPRVGGLLPADRNLIAGNNVWGLIANGATDASILGNVFGVDTAGVTVSGTAVHVNVSGTSTATIGGTTSSAGNLVVGASGTGIVVADSATSSVLGNSLSDNLGLGLDLGGDGVTANDVGDADLGPNDLLNQPVLTAAEITGATVDVTFDLDVPAGTHRIEFFTNPAGADPIGHGEGGVFVHTMDVVSTGTPLVGQSASFAGTITDDISATATVDLGAGSFGATSEFSNTMPANGAPVVTPASDRADAEDDTVSVALSGSDPDGDTLTWSATGLPTGLSISAGGTISGTISFDAAGVWTPTVRATDPAGRFDESTFTWTVTNTNRAPTVTDPGDQTSAEADVISLPVIGSDADGDGLTWSASGLPDGLTIDSGSGVISGTLSYVAEGTTTVTVTASDGFLATDVDVDWTVTNTNRPPVVSDPSTQSNAEGNSVNFTVGATDPDGQTLTWSATNLPPGLSVNPTSGEISGTLTFASAGTYSVTVTVTDPEGADDQTTFTWQVNNTNLGVTVNNPGDQANAENETVSLFVNGSDGDNDPLTWTASGLPDGLTIDSVSGEIAGTLTFDSAGAHSVTVTATDPGGANDDTTFNWSVTNTNRSPLVTDPGDRTDAENDPIVLTVAGSDPDGDTLVWSATGLPDGLTIDSATGQITGIIGFDAAGVFSTQVSAFDGTTSTAIQFDWTVTNTNRPPVVGAQPDQVAAEDDTVLVTNAATDPDGQTVAWTAAGLPDGLTIDGATGEISGTLSFDSAGMHVVTITATDPDGANDATTFQWDVTNTNRPPSLTALPDQTNAEGNDINLSVAATDPDGDTLTWTASGLPTGLTIDTSTGVISGTVPFTAAGTWTPTITATDPDGADDMLTLQWTISNTNLGVIVNSPGDQNDDELETVSVFINGSDGDNEPLTWTATGLPPGLSIDEDTGEISGTIAGDAAGDWQVEVTATEPSGLSGDAGFTWTIADVNQPPAITQPPDLSTVAGNATSFFLAAVDPDGDPVTFAASGLPPGVSINPTRGEISGTPTTAGTYTIVITATDGESDSAVSFTWTVTPPPVAPPPPPPVTSTVPPTTTTAAPTTTTTTTIVVPIAPSTVAPTTTTTTTSTIPEIEPPDGLAFGLLEANDDTIVIRGNALTTLAVLENDVLNGPVTIVDIVQPSAGQVRVLEDGSLGFEPPPGFAGELTFRYTIEAEDGQVSTAVVSLVLAVALDQTVGSAATEEVVEETADAVTTIVDSVGSLVGDVVSIRLSRLQVTMVGFALIVFLVLRVFALRRREILVQVTGVSRDQALELTGTDGEPIGLRHDATLWVRGRTGRKGAEGREIKVDTRHGEAWVDADAITDTGY